MSLSTELGFWISINCQRNLEYIDFNNFQVQRRSTLPVLYDENGSRGRSVGEVCSVLRLLSTIFRGMSFHTIRCSRVRDSFKIDNTLPDFSVSRSVWHEARIKQFRFPHLNVSHNYVELQFNVGSSPISVSWITCEGTFTLYAAGLNELPFAASTRQFKVESSLVR